MCYTCESKYIFQLGSLYFYNKRLKDQVLRRLHVTAQIIFYKRRKRKDRDKGDFGTKINIQIASQENKNLWSLYLSDDNRFIE